jgi:DNA-binding protein YbaB
MTLSLVMGRQKTPKADSNVTKRKLDNTPFKSVKEMEEASADIKMQVWKRLEYARQFQNMTENENYQFVKEELREGLSCVYGDNGDNLVKVFSEGKGVKVSINKDLVKEVEKSEAFVEALIRSTADAFSKSYYQIKGMLPVEPVELADIPRKPPKPT